MYVPVTFILILKTLTLCLAEDLQLNQKIRPLSYDIKLFPDLESGTFAGQVLINIEVADYYKTFELHGKDLQLNTSTVNLSKKYQQSLTPVKIENVVANDDRINITLGETISYGSFILEINYNGKIRDDLSGFYRSYYYYNGKKTWIASTQFEATSARKAFPCFDEPHFRTKFTLDITVPDNKYEVISNVKASSETKSIFNYHFENYPKMPTYLLAWVIYEKYTFMGTDPIDPYHNGTEYRTWARAEYFNQISFANQLQTKLLPALASTFDIPYSSSKLDKMDIVAIPDFQAGAMENWGLVTFRESRLLYHKDFSTSEDRKNIAMVIAHEFTHQWFGDLVTLDWWSYTWLNEAFARYYQYFVTLQVFTDWRLHEQFVVQVVHSALSSDSSPQHALTSEIENKDDINDMFDSITYNKGAAIVRMMEHILTPTTFKEGISKYLKTLASSLQVATPNDLLKTLSSVSSMTNDFENIMRSWTDQSGYPLITVERNLTTNIITVSQTQFLINGNSSNTTWYVPLTYTDSNEADFTNSSIKAWLNQNVKKITMDKMSLSNEDWIIFNIQQKGFYRVNYDEHNWNMIINQLKKDHTKIGNLNRAQLINDAFHLARAGIITYDKLFELTSYLSNEIDYAPWVAAANGFHYLLDQYRFKNTSYVFENLQKYIQRLAEPVLKNVGFTYNDGDKMAQKLKRITILKLVSRLDHSECQTLSNNILTELVQTSNSSYPPDIQRSLLCSALQKTSNTTLWNAVYDVYKKSIYPTQQSYYLSSLTCSEDTAALTALLNDAISDTAIVKREDSKRVFNEIGSSPNGAKFVLSYVNNSISKIIEYNLKNPKIISAIISGISDSINEQSDIDYIIQISKSHKDILGDDVCKSISKTVDKIKTKISWRQDNKDLISNALVNELTTTAPTQSTVTEGTKTTATGSTSIIPISTTPKNIANANTYNVIFIASVLLVTIFSR